MKKLSAFLLTLILSCTTAFAAPKTVTHTGTWWKEKSSLYREAFVGGYKSGMHQALGHDTNLSEFGSSELVDGLNKFYGDFRNRNIEFADAISFVADQLRGIPDDKLNAELLKMRAASAGSPADE